MKKTTTNAQREKVESGGNPRVVTLVQQLQYTF